MICIPEPRKPTRWQELRRAAVALAQTGVPDDLGAYLIDVIFDIEAGGYGDAIEYLDRAVEEIEAGRKPGMVIRELVLYLNRSREGVA